MPYHNSMNAAALPLLEHDPTLIHWDGSKTRTAALIEAAKVAANAVHDFAKPKGSRAGGVAGDAGHRAAPSSGALSVGGSSKLSLTSKATSSSSSGNLSRLTKALRTSELELLPAQILALSGKLKTADELADKLAKRGTIEDLREAGAEREKICKLQHEVRPPAASPAHACPPSLAHRLLLLVASSCSQMSCKKLQLKELQLKEGKAKKDAARGQSLQVADAADAAALPEITELNLPVALAERELCKSLADQARNTESFARANTTVAVEGAALRVSPLQGLSLSEYMLAAKHLQKEFQFDASYLIKACAALDKEGGQMPLSQLWRVAGGPPGTASAGKKVDLLMRAPLVAVRVGAGEAFDSSWLIMPKEPNTNYTQLASVMARIERRDGAQKSISKAQLRALTRLASTEADRRLIELGALDQASASKARALSGRWHESRAEALERERTMQAAVETLAAYDDLAKLDTLAEISAQTTHNAALRI